MKGEIKETAENCHQSITFLWYSLAEMKRVLKMLTAYQVKHGDKHLREAFKICYDRICKLHELFD